MAGSTQTAGVSLNSLQRSYLGVPGPGDGPELIDSAVTNQVVTLGRSDVGSSGVPNGVVVNGGGSAVGVDYRASDPNSPDRVGVYVTLSRMIGDQVDGYGLYTDLVTPAGLTTGESNPSPSANVPLLPGETYTSVDGRVSVEVLSASGATAQVKVSLAAGEAVPGGVFVSRDGAALTANVTSSVSGVAASFQWLRNGQPVTGATSQTYTAPTPDPDAVYRVVATLSAPGYASTTVSSRGIIPDDHRLSIQGTTATMVFVDENGAPVVCDRGAVAMQIQTVSGQIVSTVPMVGLLSMSASQTLGTCTVSVPVALTGSFTVTVTQSLPMYWEPLSASMVIAGSGAGASLQVGYGDFAIPTDIVDQAGEPSLRAGAGEPGLPVTVSVTDATGQSEAGVPVDLAGTAGLVFTPAQPVTDSDGFASAIVDWDPLVAPPTSDLEADVTATVAGVPAAGSPAPVQVSSAMGGRISGWLDGPLTLTADGTSMVTVHVRAWDETGVLLVDRPDLVSIQPYSLVSVSPVQWDAAGQDYVATISSTYATSGQVGISVASASGGPSVSAALDPTVTFVAGPATSLQGWSNIQTQTAASVGGCDDATPTVMTVQITPVDAKNNPAVLAAGGGVVFSVPAGSPLSIVSSPVVTTPIRISQYSASEYYLAQVTSSASGTFNITGTTLDGSISTTFPVSFLDGPLDVATSSVSVDAGPHQGNGHDAYTVTADLATTCHLPLTHLGWIGDSLEADLTDTATGQTATATSVSGFQADPSTPGRYTAKITSTQSGTDDLSVVYNSPYNFVTNQWTTSTTPLNPTSIPLEFTTSPAPVSLSSISVTTLPSTTSFPVSGQLDLSGMAVTATYSDGSTADVTPFVMTSPPANADLIMPGARTVYVVYTEAGVTQETSFVVQVSSVLSSDSSLSSLSVDAGTLTPAFDPATTAYSLDVANSVNSVTLQATANDPGATVTGTGTSQLAVGVNYIPVVVTAIDGTSTTYTITVTRAPAPVTLSSISVTTLPSTTSYTVGDQLDLSGLAVEATYSDGSSADVTSSVTTDPAAGTVLATVGSQTVDVSYTETGVTETTSFQIQVAAVPSPDSSLSSLLVDAGTLTPAFDPAVTSYSVAVANTVGSVTVQATANDAGATVTGAGTHQLAVGVNQIPVVVTAADGTSTTYMVTVTRAPTPAPVLSSISVTTPPLKTAYMVGDRLDLSGLAVTAAYSDGSTVDVTSAVTTSPAAGTVLSTVGAQTINVSYMQADVTETTSFQVQVAPIPMSTILVSPGSLSLPVGQSGSLSATVAPVDATDSSVTWTSADPSVASVDQSGQVTGVGAGSTMITVTANDGSGVTGSATVTVALPVVSGVTPMISGTAQVGSTLTADAGVWGPGGVTLAYQWLRGGVPISGATGTTYSPVSADVGQVLTVQVAGIAVGYQSTQLVSAPTSAVTAGVIVTRPVSISGAAQVGQTLTVTTGAWSPAGVALSYQWLRAGTPISGVTTSTYDPVSADVGQMLSVQVTGSLDGYSPAILATAPTEPVTETPSQSPTESPLQSPSQSPSQSATTSPSQSPSQSASGSPSQSVSQSATTTPSQTVSPAVLNVDLTNGSQITGTGTPDGAVQVLDASGSVLKGCENTTVDSSGHFMCVPTTPVKPGNSLTIIAVDPAGTRSAPVTVTVSALRATVASMTVKVGQVQTVTGYNFNPGEQVDLTLASTPVDMGTQTADVSGTVVFNFTVPQSLNIGTHTATLTGAQSGPVTGTFQVTLLVSTGGSLVASSPGLAAGAGATGIAGVWLSIAAYRRREQDTE